MIGKSSRGEQLTWSAMFRLASPDDNTHLLILLGQSVPGDCDLALPAGRVVCGGVARGAARMSPTSQKACPLELIPHAYRPAINDPCLRLPFPAPNFAVAREASARSERSSACLRQASRDRNTLCNRKS